MERVLLPLVEGKASGDSHDSTRCTSCWPCVGKVLSGLSAMASSHCVRYQKAAALGKPHRSYWPYVPLTSPSPDAPPTGGSP